MRSTAAFFARLVGVLAAAVTTLAIAVGVLGLPSVQPTGPDVVAAGDTAKTDVAAR